MAQVDVIIPLYNKESTVKRAIESIQRQTFTDWNIIAVNDGSTDKSADVVNRLNEAKIKLIHQENKGPGAARNRGIELAESEYVAFLDADDEWLPEYLENSIKALRENDVAMVSSMYFEWPKKLDTTKRWAERGIVPGKYSITKDTDPVFADWAISFLHVWNTVLKNSEARKYGSFYEQCNFAEDTIFFFKMALYLEFYIIALPSVIHHKENSELAKSLRRPLAPFFENPEIILDYCPEDKKKLCRDVITHIALRTAKNLARAGLKKQAKGLLESMPGAKTFSKEYEVCTYTIKFSKTLALWVKFKCFIAKFL